MQVLILALCVSHGLHLVRGGALIPLAVVGNLEVAAITRLIPVEVTKREQIVRLVLTYKVDW